MDFIKGNEQVRIDPSGIDISGAGHIFMDSNSVTGDISFNNKVSILDDFDVNGDVSLNGKVSILDDFDLAGNINISGNNNFVITNNGNVGIGTTTPDGKLEVKNGVIISSGDTGRIHLACETGPNYLDFWHDQDFRLRAYDGTNSDIRMTITSDGNVGIGTTSPQAGLQVTKDFHIGDVGTHWNTTASKGIFMKFGGGGAVGEGSYIQSIERSNSSNTYPMEFTASKFYFSSGYVGIGTTSPDFPLKVQAVTTAFGNNEVNDLYKDSYRGIYKTRTYSVDIDRVAQFDGGAAGTELFYGKDDALGHGSAEYSAFFKGALVIPGFEIFSDRRIKTDISLVVDDTALNQVNALESYEYNYVDPFKRKKKKTIGFIAQEVKEVIPNAYGIIKEFIPDEMRMITDPQWTEDAGKYYLNIPNLDMSGAFTNKAKFYVSNDPSGNDEVCKEVDIKEVPTTSMNEFSTTKYVAKFDESWNNVFFYGKEVSDFHTIDKAQIFALHHSAIQELDRKHEREVSEKNNKIQTLEGEVSNLTGQVSSLTSRLEALEASVLSLQNN